MSESYSVPPVVNEKGEPVVTESELAKDPARMQLYKRLLDKTETELYIMEGGVDPQLVEVHQREQAYIASDASQETPRSDEEHQEAPEVMSDSSELQIKDPSSHKTYVELEQIIAQLEKVKEDARPDHKKRWEAWSLKIQGFSAQEIAARMEVSWQLIYTYWDWCGRQVPELKQIMQEFSELTISRLEAQYRQLAIARSRGDILAHKVSLDILDQEAKILGVHKVNVQVDSKVTYVLEGVDMDKL